ncbi:hypothetical protein [Psychroflexus sp. ALD_RP9]|uniref:hypothetical protein n=1 Tax=Psychroflexus sp. ALD_RP9 TaxID=2777186 RepID=UPI001A8EF848|nr:hypothetical protein [Psychroflexus sp. ALD_RP9]QSS96644.1 hypothetical protein IMZ30_09345 [Psychroflexus sp. ALD_RP9]
MNREKYKTDFYKKVIEKRLIAYELLEILINRIQGLSQLEDGLAPMFMCLGKDYFYKTYFEIIEVINYSIWLSPETSNKVTELNVYLINEIENKLSESDNVDAELAHLGLQHRDRIKQFRQELQALVIKDFKNLHKVKSFIGNKEKDREENDHILYKNKN